MAWDGSKDSNGSWACIVGILKMGLKYDMY